MLELPQGKKYHYFLSHKKFHSKLGGVPEQVAKNLHDSLELSGLVGFFDIDDLQQINKDELEAKIKLCVTMVVTLHEETVQSEWCRFEWETAAKYNVPVKCVVDMQRCQKQEVLASVKDHPNLLAAQWTEFTERFRRQVVTEVMDFVVNRVLMDSSANDRPARQFWTRHFGTAREVAPRRLLEALDDECRKLNADKMYSAALPRLKDIFGSADLTIHKFDDLFKGEDLVSAVSAFVRQDKESGIMYKVVVLSEKGGELSKDETVNVGFLMAKEGDSLRKLRKHIKEHAKAAMEHDKDDSDDEVDEDLGDIEFLALGQFNLYLDNGAMRVLRAQENTLVGKEYIERSCIVRADKPVKSESKSIPDDGPMAPVVVPLPEADGADADVDLRAAERSGAAGALSLESAFADPDAVSALRREALKKKVGEESVAFLEAFFAVDRAGDPSALEGSVSRLAELYVAERSPMKVSVPASICTFNLLGQPLPHPPSPPRGGNALAGAPPPRRRTCRPRPRAAIASSGDGRRARCGFSPGRRR